MRKNIFTLIFVSIVVISFCLISGTVWYKLLSRIGGQTGSVAVSNEYNATTTDSNWNSSAGKLIKTGSGTLGSVVVTLSSNAPLYLYDATTTGPHSDHPTTTLAAFSSTTAGTYTFDVSFMRGLIVVGQSSVGVASTTITSR